MRHNDLYVYIIYNVYSRGCLPRECPPPPDRCFSILRRKGGKRGLGVSEREDYTISYLYIHTMVESRCRRLASHKENPRPKIWGCVCGKGGVARKHGDRGAAARDRKGGGGLFFEIWADNTTQYYMYIKTV